MWPEIPSLPKEQICFGTVRGTLTSGPTEISVVQDAGTGHWAAVGFCCVSVEIRLLRENRKQVSGALPMKVVYGLPLHCTTPCVVQNCGVWYSSALLTETGCCCKPICGWPASCSGVVCYLVLLFMLVFYLAEIEITTCIVVHKMLCFGFVAKIVLSRLSLSFHPLPCCE